MNESHNQETLFRDYLKSHPAAAREYAKVRQRHPQEEQFVHSSIEKAKELERRFGTLQIGTDRLVIVNPKPSDLDALHKLMSDPDVMRYVGRGPRDRDEVNEGLQRSVAHYQKYGYSMGLVYEKETGNWIGHAGLRHLGFDDTQPEIDVGYALFKEYWGWGYATELAQACIDWGFQQLPVDYLIAIVFPNNLASRRVLEKVGMRYVKNIQYNDNEVAYYRIDRGNTKNESL